MRSIKKFRVMELIVVPIASLKFMAIGIRGKDFPKFGKDIQMKISTAITYIERFCYCIFTLCPIIFLTCQVQTAR